MGCRRYGSSAMTDARLTKYRSTSKYVGRRSRSGGQTKRGLDFILNPFHANIHESQRSTKYTVLKYIVVTLFFLIMVVRYIAYVYIYIYI
jgi:hypothetical protein